MGQEPKHPLPYFVTIIGTFLSVLLAQVFVEPCSKLDKGLKNTLLFCWVVLKQDHFPNSS